MLKWNAKKGLVKAGNSNLVRGAQTELSVDGSPLKAALYSAGRALATNLFNSWPIAFCFHINYPQHHTHSHTRTHPNITPQESFWVSRQRCWRSGGEYIKDGCYWKGLKSQRLQRILVKSVQIRVWCERCHFAYGSHLNQWYFWCHWDTIIVSVNKSRGLKTFWIWRSG